MCHAALWRIARPTSDARALFLIFLGVPAAAALGFMGAGTAFAGGGWPQRLDVLAMLLLHWALSLAYIQTYPAVQAQSPSLEIVYAVFKSMPRGLSREELLTTLDTRQLVGDRVEDLVANRLIRAAGDLYILTPGLVGIVHPTLLSCMLVAPDAPSVLRLPVDLTYGALVYACLAYSYFHLNMSETAHRARGASTRRPSWIPIQNGARSGMKRIRSRLRGSPRSWTYNTRSVSPGEGLRG
jgi:hypothetical protein